MWSENEREKYKLERERGEKDSKGTRLTLIIDGIHEDLMAFDETSDVGRQPQGTSVCQFDGGGVVEKRISELVLQRAWETVRPQEDVHAAPVPILASARRLKHCLHIAGVCLWVFMVFIAA